MFITLQEQPFDLLEIPWIRLVNRIFRPLMNSTVVMGHWITISQILYGIDPRLDVGKSKSHNHLATEFAGSHFQDYDDFLSLAVKYGLTDYVAKKLDQNKLLITERKGPLYWIT
jgi:hypothetical protein